jgi:hypothetical protein
MNGRPSGAKNRRLPIHLITTPVSGFLRGTRISSTRFLPTTLGREIMHDHPLVVKPHGLARGVEVASVAKLINHRVVIFDEC